MSESTENLDQQHGHSTEQGAGEGGAAPTTSTAEGSQAPEQHQSFTAPTVPETSEAAQGTGAPESSAEASTGADTAPEPASSAHADAAPAAVDGGEGHAPVHAEEPVHAEGAVHAEAPVNTEEPVHAEEGAVADGTATEDTSVPAETGAPETSGGSTTSDAPPAEGAAGAVQGEEWWSAPQASAPEAAASPDEADDPFPVDAGVSLDFDRTWQRIEEDFQQKRTLSALVVDRVKGGLVVDIGVQGFVPASQVASGRVHDLDRFVGTSLRLRITDLDRERQRVVLSARQVAEEEHTRRKSDTMGKLKVGLITEGVVRRLTDFGAFVDIGGVDGLLHVSEMSWSRIKHPKEAVNPGDRVRVKVLKISDDKRKISLGMRQLLPDPWNSIDQHYKVGDMVSGRVARVASFGAFVHIRDGVEAMLPNSEVTSRKPRPEDLPQVGDTVNAKIIELKPELRQMRLSVRKIQEDEERHEYQQHVQQTKQQSGGSRTTIGDLFGHIIQDWKDDRADGES